MILFYKFIYCNQMNNFYTEYLNNVRMTRSSEKFEDFRH